MKGLWILRVTNGRQTFYIEVVLNYLHNRDCWTTYLNLLNEQGQSKTSKLQVVFLIIWHGYIIHSDV